MAGTERDGDGGIPGGAPPRTLADDAIAPLDPSPREGPPPPSRYTLLDARRFREAGERIPAPCPDDAVVGRGGMGRVLLALDTSMGRVVAIKEAHRPPASEDPAEDGLTRRFLREARVTGALEHPGIVPVHEIGARTDGAPYYTMRLVRGRSLRQALARAHTLRERLALLPHVVDLCHAIAFAHSQGVIHRDIKPDNVMVGAFGETVVLDWGLARERRVRRGPQAAREAPDTGTALAHAASHTRFGVMGTPAWMSPEQAGGRPEDIDEASDIWALGMILYRLLTGTLPAPGESSEEIMAWLRDPHRPLEPPRRRCPEAPAELASVALRCLQPSKEDRYPSAAEVARDLERYQAGERVVVHRYTVWELLRHMVHRNRPLSAAVAAGIVAAVAAAVLFALHLEARREATRYREQNALEQVFLARAALDGGRPQEAQARLRSSLESADSLLARALWARLQDTPLLLRHRLETEITGLAFSPDGAQLAVASASPDLVLLDAWTGATRTLAGPDPDLYVVGWSSAGDQLAAGSGAGDVVWWPVPGEPPVRLSGHADIVSSVAFDEGGERLLSGSFDGTVRLWDLRSRATVRTWTAHEGPVTCVVWNPSETGFATASADRTVRVWSLQPAEPQAVLEGHEGEVTGLFYGDDGRTLYSSSYDGTVRTWDIPTGRQTDLRSTTSSGYTILTRGRSGGPMAAADKQGHIHLWRSPNAAEARTLEGQRSMVFALAMDGPGARVASGGIDRTVSLWNTDAFGRKRAPPGHSGVVTSVAVLPGGERLASAGWDGTVRLWDASTGQRLDAWEAHEDIVHAVATAPGGTTLATAGADRTVRLWDPDRGELRAVLTGHRGAVLGLSFHPRGDRLATAGDDGRVLLWNLEQGTRRAVLEASGRTCAAFAPDGGALALGWTGRGQGVLRVVEPETGKTRAEATVEATEIASLAFTGAGDALVVMARDGRILTWDLHEDALETTAAPAGRGRAAVPGPAGRYLAATSTLPEVRLFDTGRGDRLTLAGHRGPVAGAAFTPGGERLFTAGYDGTVRAWDPETGRPAWRGTGILPVHGFRHDHTGWRSLDREKAPPPDTAWARAVATGGRLVAESPAEPPATHTVCLQTWDGTLALWNAQTDEMLSSAVLPRARALVATSAGCAALAADGRVWLLPPSPRESPQLLSESARALTRSAEGGVWVVEAKALRGFGPAGTATESRSLPVADPTAAAITADGVFTGDARGGIRWMEAGGTQAGLPLADTPSSAVRALEPGPADTVCAGFDDGTVGVWDPSSGAALVRIRLHGPVLHLAMRGSTLHALTETGDSAAVPLEELGRDRCDLLRAVWSRVPVCWAGGDARPCPPPADHRCRSAAPGRGTSG